MLYIYDIYNVERISIYVIMNSTETSIPSIVKHKRDVFPTDHGAMIGICTSVTDGGDGNFSKARQQPIW